MTSQVSRPFGFWTAIALVVGGMIGAGIFVLPAQLAPYGWTGLVAWAVAIAGALVIGLVMVALMRRMPDTTGLVDMCAQGLGPLPGVVMGWSYWISCWSAVSVMSLTATGYLAVFIPSLTSTPLAHVTTAVGLIAAITVLNIGGIRLAGAFQVITTVLKLLPLLAVILIFLGLLLTGSDSIDVKAQAAFTPAQLTPALTMAFFALVGFEAASVVTERIKDPARNVTRATVIGLIVTGLLYILISNAITLALPPDEVAASSAPFALFVERYWGHGAGLLTAAFAAISVVGAMNCWILVQGDVLLGMSRAGLIPAWVGKTNARDVPVGLLIVSSLCACTLVLSSATRTMGGLLDLSLLMTTAASLWLYAGVCVAALLRRVARVLAVAGLGFCVWAMAGSGFEVFWLSLVLMFTGVPLYWLSLRQRRAATT